MKKIASHLYFWVVISILIGACIGHIFPSFGASLKPVGDGFISLIKMLISPVIFCTVVLGIAGAGDLKKVGRVGAKALLYFEIVSSLTLVIGLFVANLMRPGQGFNVDPKSLDSSLVSEFAKKAGEQSALDFILHIIPKTFFDAFTASGDLLQVLLLAILTGLALNKLGTTKTRAIHDLLEAGSKMFFNVMHFVMKLAPLGAGAAMAFTIRKFGLSALAPLAKLILTFYATCLLFVIVVLGTIAKAAGFSIFGFIKYIREELLIVLGTSSSETALVPLMEKLEKLGCSKSVIGLVVPSGYSFNLDGTSIYMSLAVIFLAQALNIDLSWGQQLSILGIALLTSKGASGVSGSGFITLAATLAVVPSIPVAGLALILGIDRFMSEARALTNIIGNGVATLVVAKWEKEIDLHKLRTELRKT